MAYEVMLETLKAVPEMRFPAQVDNTLRSSWVKCQTQARWAHFQRLSSPYPNVHRHAGGAFAAGLEHTRVAFYGEGADADYAVAAGVKALTEYYGDFVAPEKGTGANKTYDRMVEALESYFREYPLGRDTLIPLMLPSGPAVEFTFAIALPFLNPDSGDPILYSGRFDMLAGRSGSLWVTDEKTTVALGPQWAQQWDLDSQMTGYCWAARHYGFDVAGAIIRGIGILKTEIKHIEVPVFRPTWQIDRWKEELYADIQAMINAYRNGEFRMALSYACADFGGCAYRNLCLSQDPDRWIVGNFAERNWDPLSKGE